VADPQSGTGPRRRTGPFPHVPVVDRSPWQWPNGSRLALWVIPNIEVFALDEVIPGGTGRAPDVPLFSHRDYGNRIGVWRIMEVLDRHGVRATVALNSEVCDACPRVIEEGCRRGWEWMGHGESNTRRLTAIDPADEGRVVRGVVDRIAAATGVRPQGWLGPGLQETWNTLGHLCDAGLTYVADWVNDDQPYDMDVAGRRLVSVPYSWEVNDKPVYDDWHASPAEFEAMIRRQFDVLYRESAASARVMAIALHPYLTGVPHRIDALDGALAYILRHPGVWRTTGAEIAAAYREVFPR
jgi:allantoinase